MGGPFGVLPDAAPDAGPDAGPAGGQVVALAPAVLSDLASLVVDGAPLGLVLQRLAIIAARAVPGAGAVSITLVRGRAASSAGFTGGVAAALDERQYEDGFGPCLHAAATVGEVIVADTAASDAYPDFAAVAARRGITSALAIGLAVAGPASAAINVYRDGPSAGGDEGASMAPTMAAARVFAAYAAVAISNAAALDDQRTTATQLGAAMASRAGIEQAKGVLMAQRAITADAAFAALRATSQKTNVKLAAVAAAVVAATAGGQG